MRDQNSDDPRTPGASDPQGRVFRWSLGPFHWAVGGAVAANRVAFTFAFGTDGGTRADRREDQVSVDEDATTIEIDEG